MSGFVAVEMYLALADELKAYRDKNQFLETEVQGLRTRCQELEMNLVKKEEEMELVYAQYKTHADKNQFLKSQMKKMQTSPIIPLSSIPSPTSLSPSVELPALEEVPENVPLLAQNSEEPMFEPVSEGPGSQGPLNETIWCGPEPGSMNFLDEEPDEFILEEVPTTLPSFISQTKNESFDVKKTSQNKRPKVIKTSSITAKKSKLELNENHNIFACRVSPCGYVTFQSLDEHHEHLKINHPHKPFICTRCPHATNTKHALYAHEKTHYKNDLAYREHQQGGFCKLCDITFAGGNNGRYKTALRKHNNQFH